MKKIKRFLYVMFLALLVSGLFAEEMPLSGIVTEVMAATTPAQPVLVSATTSGGTKVVVKWKAAAGATGYRIYRKTKGGSWKKLKTVSGSSKVSYTDTTAKTGVLYYYTVKAYRKENGVTTWSTIDRKGVNAILLETPTLVSAKVSDTSKITVSWKTVPAAGGYRIYRKTSSTGAWKKLKTVSGQATASYTDSSVETGKKYYYTVKAYAKKSGNTFWSTVDKAGVKATLTIPAPKLVSATAAGETSIVLKWEPVSDVAGYRVYVKNADGTWKTVKTLSGQSNSSYTIKNLAPATTYTYTVRAYKVINNAKVWGKYSSSGISATTESGGIVTQNTKLKSYILSNGKYSEGWYYIGYACSYDEVPGFTYTWTISYNPTTSELEYGFALTEDSDAGGVILAMTGNPINSSTMKIEYVFYDNTVSGAAIAEASLNMNTYAGQNLTFKITESEGLSSEEINEMLGIANDTLTLGFEGWQAYVLEGRGFDLQSLGFRAYPEA